MKLTIGTSQINGRGLIALCEFASGEAILKVELDERLERPFFHVLNHSCEPNAWIDNTCTVRACKRIKAGQEITVDYLENMDVCKPFYCRCGAVICREKIEVKWNGKQRRLAGKPIAGQPGSYTLTWR